MGNPVLGKGMKDLLPKKFEVQKEEKDENGTYREELKVTIKRYRAQGFDVDMLQEIKDKPIDEVKRGVERYRNAIKKLKSAMTILKSLEGYGYNYEIDQILENIKNPSMADRIHDEAEKLKDRAFSEHDIRPEKKITPGEKVLNSLKTRSEVVNGEAESDDVDPDKLDALLNDLDGLGDDMDLDIDDQDLFSDEEEPQDEIEEEEVPEEPTSGDETVPVTPEEEIEEEEVPEEPTSGDETVPVTPEEEIEEEGVPEESPSGDETAPVSPEEEVPETPDRQVEPESGERAKIEQDLDETISEPKEPELPESDVETDMGVEEPAEEGGETIPQQEEVSQASEEEIAEEPTSSEPEGTPPDIDKLMEDAKESYKEGDLEGALEIFEEILKWDRENAKAKFMSRRLQSKLDSS